MGGTAPPIISLSGIYHIHQSIMPSGALIESINRIASEAMQCFQIDCAIGQRLEIRTLRLCALWR